MHDPANTFSKALAAAIDHWPLTVSPAQAAKLFHHYSLTVDQNRTLNLTRITEVTDAAVKHYADSLSLLAWARENRITFQTLLDVGTGAGFPAVPLAALCPGWRITAIDGTRKKIEFVKRSARAIGLTNLNCVHAHSKHWKTEETFEIVTCRALAGLAELLEQTGRFLARHGVLVVYKTTAISEVEQRSGRRACRDLQLELTDTFAYQLRLYGDRLDRVLLIYRRRP